jgi:hypothetical protein
MWGALSDERTGLSFTIATGARQRSHSRIRVPWDLRPYFTVLDSILLFSSPPTARRVTVEVLDPASTRDELPSLLNPAEAEAYCRQSPGTLTPGIGPRWDPWPYICSIMTPGNLIFLSEKWEVQLILIDLESRSCQRHTRWNRRVYNNGFLLSHNGFPKY